jgi:hypothetical protein
MEKPFAANLLIDTVQRLMPKKRAAAKPKPVPKPVVVEEEPSGPTNLEPDRADLPAEATTYDELEPPWLANVVPLDSSTELMFADPTSAARSELIKEPSLPRVEIEIEIDDLPASAEGDSDAESEAEVEKVVMSGRLGVIAIDAILELAAKTTAAISCRFEQDDAEIELAFRAGKIAWAKRTPEAGALKRASLHESVRSILRRTTEESVRELAAWKTGVFAMVSHAIIPAELAAIDLALDLEVLIGRRIEARRRSDRG